MARLSLRDRFFTPPVARAITSPAGHPRPGRRAPPSASSSAAARSGPWCSAWSPSPAGSALAIPRDAAGRSHRSVHAGRAVAPLRARTPSRPSTRFEEAVGGAKAGPLRDRLREIESQGRPPACEEVWRIARRGHDLVDARRRVDPDAIRREIAATEANAGQPWATESTLDAPMESLQASWPPSSASSG